MYVIETAVSRIKLERRLTGIVRYPDIQHINAAYAVGCLTANQINATLAKTGVMENHRRGLRESEASSRQLSRKIAKQQRQTSTQLKK